MLSLYLLQFIACAHLKQTSKNMELILENQALPEDNSKSSMQSHDTLKIADTKKNRRSFANFQGNMKEELIPLHPNSSHFKDKVCQLFIYKILRIKRYIGFLLKQD